MRIDKKILTGIVSENFSRVYISYFKRTRRTSVYNHSTTRHRRSGNAESISTVCSSSVVSSWNYSVSLLLLLLLCQCYVRIGFVLDFHIVCKHIFECLSNGMARHNVWSASTLCASRYVCARVVHCNCGCCVQQAYTMQAPQHTVHSNVCMQVKSIDFWDKQYNDEYWATNPRIVLCSDWLRMYEEDDDDDDDEDLY